MDLILAAILELVEELKRLGKTGESIEEHLGMLVHLYGEANGWGDEDD